MSINPLAAKIATPYARALYDFSVEQNLMHQITADFQNLEVFLTQNSELTNYLNNPVIGANQKQEVLDKTLKSQLNQETFKFLSVLVNRDRINLLPEVISCYLELVSSFNFLIKVFFCKFVNGKAVETSIILIEASSYTKYK
jgi:F-type H+-transporting ATPase subunit delta